MEERTIVMNKLSIDSELLVAASPKPKLPLLLSTIWTDSMAIPSGYLRFIVAIASILLAILFNHCNHYCIDFDSARILNCLEPIFRKGALQGAPQTRDTEPKVKYQNPKTEKMAK